jgi:hypothetical protein
VNAIAAGTIVTDATRVIADDAALRTEVEVATPLRRLGTVEGVAAGVVYFASPAGAYVTGAVLEVHGGLQAPATGHSCPTSSGTLLGLPTAASETSRALEERTRSHQQCVPRSRRARPPSSSQQFATEWGFARNPATRQDQQHGHAADT